MLKKQKACLRNWSHDSDEHAINGLFINYGSKNCHRYQ